MTRRPSPYEIASKLMGPGSRKPLKRNGNGYMTLCPSHPDRNPSLSIRSLEDGTIVATCFGCSTERAKLYADIEEVLGYPMNPLNSQAPAGESPRGTSGTAPRRPPVNAILPIPAYAPAVPKALRTRQYGAPTAIWTYRDIAGQPIAHVARYQNGPDKVIWPWIYGVREGQRGWHVAPLPAPRPLYNLHRIAATDERTPVIVCEGEKAADAAAELFPGWVSTTTMGGSQAPHLTDFMPLKNRLIIVSYDNDMPGIRYAASVADLCLRAGAREIRLFRYPTKWIIGTHGLEQAEHRYPEGTDLADLLASGWTADHLREVSRRGTLLTWPLRTDWPAGPTPNTQRASTD